MKEDNLKEKPEINDTLAGRQGRAADGAPDGWRQDDTSQDGSDDEKSPESSAGKDVLADNSMREGAGLYGVDAAANDPNGYDEFFFQRRIRSSNNHWSIAWSDLMMTMFILFMVMFVYKSSDREFLSGKDNGSFSGPEIGREVVAEGPGGANDFNEFGQKAYARVYDFSRLTNLESEMRDFAQINLSPDNTLRIILTGDLLFPLGGISLKDKSRGLLRKIAIFLRDSPYMINVLGHTDNTPIRGDNSSSNWELSASRASAVARYLIAETKLPARQFSVTGFAEFRPVAPNDSPENRAKNRRVEIVITKEKSEPLPLGGGDL